MKTGLPMSLALALAACGSSSLPPEADQQPQQPQQVTESLVVSADAQGIHLKNRSTTDLLVAVVDSLFFENGFALWCMGQDECGSPLPAGASLLVPRNEVIGPPPRHQAVSVFWWDVRPDLTPEQKSGRFRRTSIRLP